MNSQKCGCSDETCGGCEGTRPITPVSEINRPGLAALAYRVGTHGAFLETMKARLATMTVPAGDSDNGAAGAVYSPLLGLTTRDSSDPAIALLDCWATVADVLTFYQERIANEGFLRTAIERRSVLELARLIGYTLRPGVASSVYLAYTLNPNQTDPVNIPAGAQSQSIPGPGELPQTFETSADLTARTDWNNLPPRMTQPQVIHSADGLTLNTGTIYLQGVTTNLNPNDTLLLQVSGAPNGILAQVATVTPDFTNSLTTVTLQGTVNSSVSKKPDTKVDAFMALLNLSSSTGNLAKPPALQLPGSTYLARDVGSALEQKSDTLTQALTVLKPSIAASIYAAWANSGTPVVDAPKVYAFRVKASPFGSVAPLMPVTNAQGIVVGTEEWPIGGTVACSIVLTNSGPTAPSAFVSLTLDGLKQTAAVSLSTLPSNSIPLGLGQVQVSLTNHYFYTFVFTYPASGASATLTITLSILSNGTQTAEINDQTSNVNLAISSGNVVTCSTATYETNLSLSADSSTFTVEVDDLPLPQAEPAVVYLDALYNQIQTGTWAALVRADGVPPVITMIGKVESVAMAEYGITGKSTKLSLGQAWLQSTDQFLSVLRGTTVYAQCEPLQLALQPYQPDAQGNPADVGPGPQGANTTIELDGLFDGLTSGRWVIVAGERTDIKDAYGNVVAGVNASELAMIATVTQGYDISLPGDPIHTTIQLATPLAYSYKRSSVTIYGNVVDATNGATTNETLGSGDGSQALLSFALKQPPLTFVSAATPAGATSTLEVFVNNVQWQEVDTLAGLGPKDRCFVTQTDDNGVTTVIFGDGVQGARPPTGVGNVQAVYRKGIGQPGNVKAGEITMLTTKPLGVNAVVNPLDATGGADEDAIDQARANAPVAVLSLDRLVSIQDYADFSRTFAGVGKAASVRLSDGLRERVYITIAGADDEPIATTSDLYNNLTAALLNYGDAALAVQVSVRELKLMVLSAKVCLLADYQWDSVSPAIRAALLNAFSFQNTDLAQPVILSQAISVIQSVAGVEYVDVVCFGSLPENFTAADLSALTSARKVADAIPSLAARLGPTVGTGQTAPILPAQLVYLTPNVPDTLILNQIT